MYVKKLDSELALSEDIPVINEDYRADCVHNFNEILNAALFYQEKGITYDLNSEIIQSSVADAYPSNLECLRNGQEFNLYEFNAKSANNVIWALGGRNCYPRV